MTTTTITGSTLPEATLMTKEQQQRRLQGHRHHYHHHQQQQQQQQQQTTINILSFPCELLKKERKNKLLE